MDAIVNRLGVEKKFFDLCTKVVNDLGLELYDLDYVKGQSTLRVFIRNPKTATAVLDDCVAVDRALTPYIDTEEWVPQKLTLEVSSPGLYRNLRTLEQLKSAVGETVMINISGDLNEHLKFKGQKKFRGKLISADNKYVNIQLADMNDELNIPLEQIKKAQLDPDVKNLMQGDNL